MSEHEIRSEHHRSTGEWQLNLDDLRLAELRLAARSLRLAPPGLKTALSLDRIQGTYRPVRVLRVRVGLVVMPVVVVMVMVVIMPVVVVVVVTMHQSARPRAKRVAQRAVLDR